MLHRICSLFCLTASRKALFCGSGMFVSAISDYASMYKSPPNVSKQNVKLGLCQMLVRKEKEANIQTAEKYIRDAASQGADLVVLPEMWNCPYSNDSFPVYAENIPDVNTALKDVMTNYLTLAVYSVIRDSFSLNIESYTYSISIYLVLLEREQRW
eukprot:TRINITY_DN6680_c0_g1_i2.p2 TRINITY_DN6680_c0_g1~~TRINITY_DN6680_c0_g1_i2.p2  ORF type:complete len:156 (+),score=9.46 TRINITY_DN6680_c0_g1_i2:38-505(+)